MFRVLEKSRENKPKISKILNFIVIFLTAFLILFFLTTIIFWSINFQKYLVYKWTGGVYAFFILFKIIHHNFFQQKKGVFVGELIFADNEINVLDKNYPLDIISKIRIRGNDIKGEFRGLKSEGINNELIINLKNGDELNYFFEQTKENNLKDILFLKKYADEEKLAQLNYDSIIDNTNYY